MEEFRVLTDIYFGENALERLSKIPYKKVFIIADPFVVSGDLIRYIRRPLEKAGIEYELFTDVVPDPPIEKVTAGVKAFLASGCDCIVTVGGGSALDTAKSVRKIAAHMAPERKFYLIAIPTTSGTGSEVTSFSIITNAQTQVKQTLISEDMTPNEAVLDAILVKSVPASVTADTGLDVLTHAIEAYVSTKHNEFSSALAEKAIEITGQFLFRSYSNAQDTHARNKMHVAACIAGLAFNSASLGLNHGMAHQLGAHFHVPHGRANAILLPIVIEYNTGITGVTRQSEVVLPCVERYCNIARLLGLHGSNEVMTIHSLCNYLRFCANEMKIPSHLHEILPKVTLAEYEAAIPEMADHALEDSCTATNPRTPSKAEVEELFRKLW